MLRNKPHKIIVRPAGKGESRVDGCLVPQRQSSQPGGTTSVGAIERGHELRVEVEDAALFANGQVFAVDTRSFRVAAAPLIFNATRGAHALIVCQELLPGMTGDVNTVLDRLAAG